MSDGAPDHDEMPIEDERVYTPEPGEAQLTARAVIVGCLVGSVVSCTNVYIGLKIGWSFGASIISAVLAFSVFSVMGKRLSVLETNTAQTAGSAAGFMSSAAGLLAAIPAMDLLGYEIPWHMLVLWALGVAFLGVFFAVPLRRQYVEVDKLKFPTGTATAATIMAMFSEAAEAMAKSRILLTTGILAGAFTLCSHFAPELESPPLDEWLAGALVAEGAELPSMDDGVSVALLATIAATLTAWTFKIYLGPSLFGAGFLIGPRVVLSLVLGAIIGWGVLGPYVQHVGWAPGDVMDFKTGPRGWILWPGVALMVSEALASVAMSWRSFVNVLRFSGASSGAESLPPDHAIPNSWWIGGLVCGATLTVAIASTLFGIPWYLALLGVVLSAVLSAVATRSLGETDINPVGGMGKVTQLVFGILHPGNIASNLMAAGITAGGASQAADMMQDLRTGYLLRASPRKQFLAQLCGICAGIIFAVPAYHLLTSAYELGGEKLPAPAAFAWKAMAELLVDGPDALPEHATTAVVIASLVGVALACLRTIKSIRDYVPSGLAMGIAFIVQAYYSLVMFYGLVIWFIWKRVSPSTAEKYTFAVAAGLIAGEGLMGLVNAGLTLLGIG